MSILNRESLADGSYRTGLAIPKNLGWSDQQIDQSFAQMWRIRPSGPVWVFAYGSLIWNPLMPFTEQRNAKLRGWHRSFCLRSISGRGSPDQPGRVLSLLPGGSVQGMAMRLSDSTVEQELRLLWTREMAGGGYVPTWVALNFYKATTVCGLVFVANTANARHESDDRPDAVAPLIVSARGAIGPNIDYVFELHRAMAELDIADPYIDEVVAAVLRCKAT